MLSNISDFVPAQTNTAATFQFTENRLIIVEGKDEVECIQHWLKQWGIDGVQVADTKGKDRLNEWLRVLRLDPHYSALTSILVVRDADSSAASAFTSVRSRLESNNFFAPQNPWQWEEQTQRPAVAVSIMPGNGRLGALEELLLDTVAEDDFLSQCRAYIESAYAYRAAQGLILSPEHKGKATAVAYLVSRKPNLSEVRRGAREGLWPHDHPALLPLKELIQQMP